MEYKFIRLYVLKCYNTNQPLLNHEKTKLKNTTFVLPILQRNYTRTRYSTLHAYYE